MKNKISKIVSSSLCAFAIMLSSSAMIAHANIISNNISTPVIEARDILSQVKSGKVKIATVYSEGTPQEGQDHRSSGNFSTQFNFNGYNSLYWEVTGVSNPDVVIFDVMKDKSVLKDPVIFSNLRDGSVTSVKKERPLYIANPKGTCGKPFSVTVYAFNQ